MTSAAAIRRQPPRLVAKTLAVTFGTVFLLLLVVFAVVMYSVREQVRQSVTTNLESSQRLFATLETRRQHELVSQAATLGYWMGEPYAGQGYMCRAVRAVLAYAFERQGLHRIEAACLPNNEPSKRLLEHLGFAQEGYARAYLNINGQWRDHLLFGLLDTDPLPLRAPTLR